jgi:death-on-curing protein
VTEVRYLDLEDLLTLVRALRAGPVQDVGLLDAAAGRPAASAFGDEAYAGVALKAAALLHSLAGNHALVDGNKRLAWLAAVVFLDVNGHRPDLSDDEAFALVMAVADGTLDAVDDIAAGLRVEPVRTSRPPPP